MDQPSLQPFNQHRASESCPIPKTLPPPPPPHTLLQSTPHILMLPTMPSSSHQRRLTAPAGSPGQGKKFLRFSQRTLQLPGSVQNLHPQGYALLVPEAEGKQVNFPCGPNPLGYVDTQVRKLNTFCVVSNLPSFALPPPERKAEPNFMKGIKMQDSPIPRIIPLSAPQKLQLDTL